MRPIQPWRRDSRPSDRPQRDATSFWFSRYANIMESHISGLSAPAICTKRKLIIMKKKIPTFRSDKEAEGFVDTADLSEYDLSGARPVRFEFEKKAARINMRLPAPLLEAVKEKARARGIPYQRFIRETLEQAVTNTNE